MMIFVLLLYTNIYCGYLLELLAKIVMCLRFTNNYGNSLETPGGNASNEYHNNTVLLWTAFHLELCVSCDFNIYY